MFDRHVAFAARQMPYVIAVSNGREHVNYRDLDRAIDGVATLLADALGERNGEVVVGIAVRDGYRHALLTLACARLGVASASLFTPLAQPLAGLVGASLLVTDERVDGGLIVDHDWFARAAAQPARTAPPAAITAGSLARVHLSSGSTGEPKAVEISWAAFEARIGSGLFGNGDGMRRVLSLIGPESGALQLMLTTWKHRGCVLFGPDAPVGMVAALPVLQPTGLLASPAQLAALLDALPADWTPLVGLEVAVGGGKLSPTLAHRIAVRLGARVTVVYASSEAGTTALGYAASLPDDGAVGFVLPATLVDIVDDAGACVPAGAVGQLRIAGTELARGYREGDRRQAFDDGRFMPGDLGSLDAAGLLRIVGRVDEVMNLGGEKFLPDALEDKVRGVAGVADVAAFALEDADGASQPWLAIVRDGTIAAGAIDRAIATPGLPMVHIAWIEAIPRTAMGKVRREELREAARRLSGGAGRGIDP